MDGLNFIEDITNNHLITTSNSELKMSASSSSTLATEAIAMKKEDTRTEQDIVSPDDTVRAKQTTSEMR